MTITIKLDSEETELFRDPREKAWQQAFREKVQRVADTFRARTIVENEPGTCEFYRIG